MAHHGVLNEFDDHQRSRRESIKRHWDSWKGWMTLSTSHLPALLCEVHGVFVATFFCYLVPIPAFLLYLFAKQHLALQTTKLLVSFSKEKTSEGKELHFARIPSDSDSQLVELKD